MNRENAGYRLSCGPLKIEGAGGGLLKFSQALHE